MEQAQPNSRQYELTEEQLQIVNHPDGRHARVLAVAGSGKTTTMAHRVVHLLQNRGVQKHQIQVLMFNHLARNEFIAKLEELGLSRGQQPHVNTFHSYAYRVGQLTAFKQWFADYEELATLELRRTIDTVVRKIEVEKDDIDLEEADRAIGLWKGSLIPPSRAGYSGFNAEAYLEIYREFERRRLEKNAITFDDFVPLAVALVGSDRETLAKHAGSLRYIIVDEYQDINLGQQRLVELLASRGADVMVVGDDDQTIYEWRGARSEYILREFMTTFHKKQHSEYRLSHSFRFGYSIAQAAFNVITHNTNRNEKTLIANEPTQRSHISTFSDATVQGGHVNKHLVEEIITLVKTRGVKPSNIRVLGRTYAQLNSISTEFLLGRIPFRVEGRAPFVKAGECQVLLDYLRVASCMDKVPDEATIGRFPNIANKPSRFLARLEIIRMLQEGRNENISLRELLRNSTQDSTRFERESQRQNLEDLSSVLEELAQKIHADRDVLAGELMEWIRKRIGLEEHYKTYYGEGDASFVRIQNIHAFQQYANFTRLTWKKFIAHVDSIDTTQGRPENSWIRMTTIHRTKGLEFDYVFIPDCQEGYMPVFGDGDDPTFDTKFPKREPKPAEWIENERRLFYVGITRAKKGLYIGAPSLRSEKGDEPKDSKDTNVNPSRFLEEWELGPTLAIEMELARAAMHIENHQLVQKCHQFNAYHKIVGVVKQYYSKHFTAETKRKLARIQLSNAERPFLYQGRYDSKRKEGAGTKRDSDSNDEMWDWIPEPQRAYTRLPTTGRTSQSRSRPR